MRAVCDRRLASATERMVCGAAVAAAAAGAAGQATFRGLNDALTGFEVGGVSANGGFVVGSAGRGSPAYRWSAAQGMIPITPHESVAHGVSANGAVVVGQSIPGARQLEAFRWSWPAGSTFLGSGSDASNAVSANGQVIVGHGTDDSHTRAFRWTAAGGLVYLGTLPGDDRSEAHDTSATGAVVVGESNNGFTSPEAFIWTSGGGMVGLGFVPGSNRSAAAAVSADGTTVVGDGFREGFRWTATTGMLPLGVRPGNSAATDVSGDGRVVIGDSGLFGDSPPFLWTPETGTVDLADFLEAHYGLNLTGWTLGTAVAISDDGRVIVGYGVNPEEEYESWMVTLPAAPCGTPAAPTQVVASDGTVCNAVRIGWTGNTAHVGTYEIWRGPAANGTGAAMIGLDTASPYFDATGAGGTTYWYFVRARNSCGKAGPFAGNAGWRASGTPAAPTGIAASDGTICGYTRVAWNAVAGAASYTIWRTTELNPGTPVQVGIDLASPFFDDAPTGQGYIYYVRAVSACGVSPLSAGNVGRESPPAVAPAQVTASDGTITTHVRVGWTPSIGATYTIWRATSNNPAAAVQVGAAITSPFFDPAPTLNEYWYFVKAHTACGVSALSPGNAGRRKP